MDAVTAELPADIAAGIDPNQPDLLQKRQGWNRPAPAHIALPTETWRELIDRRSRYQNTTRRIAEGSLTTINEFITHNLNIRDFAQHTLETTPDPRLILNFYRALASLTVLDPTCGSGAFLFAALNILEPLYETCLMRMRTFVEEEDRLNANDRQTFRNTFREFRDVLAEVQSPQHPNLRYFVYKSIILNNLFGVDIMREATEIAKLRLFLKLVSTVDADADTDNFGLEPLPDVDFNIRAGNTLIGFATETELDRGLQYTIEGVLAKPGIEEQMELVSRAFNRYKTSQLDLGPDNYADLRAAKQTLRQRLATLNDALNHLLHKQYAGIPFGDWCAGHKPFHWLAEYYEIIKIRGGFDVIIGNPPYVSVRDVQYRIPAYESVACGDIYAVCVERSAKQLLKNVGKYGMIVPISITSTDGYSSLRKVFVNESRGAYLSNFSMRPSKLFDGVDKRLTVFISHNERGNIFSTKYYWWQSEERGSLFQNLSYQKVDSDVLRISGFPKISSQIEESLLNKLKKNNKSVKYFLTSTASYSVKYTRKLRYFIQFFNDPPLIYNYQGVVVEPTELKSVKVGTLIHKQTLNSLLNSNLFFWFFIAFSDCRNVNTREINSFPVDLEKMIDDHHIKLGNLAQLLTEDLKKNSVFIDRNDQRAGFMRIQSFQPRHSKPIIDEIDKVLAVHYGFSAEELDFIINYDIKYRMGRDTEEAEAE